MRDNGQPASAEEAPEVPVEAPLASGGQPGGAGDAATPPLAREAALPEPSSLPAKPAPPAIAPRPDPSSATWWRVEFALVALNLLLLGLWAVRLWKPQFMEGPLVPCMATALLPGTVLCIARLPSLWLFRLGVAGGLIAWMILKGTIDFALLGAALQRWPWMLAGLASIAIVPMAGMVRWWLLLRGLRFDLGLLQSVRIYMAAWFFNQFVPGATGGDLFRLYYVAKTHPGRIAAATTSVALDRFLGIPAWVGLMGLGVALNWSFLQAIPEFQGITTGVAALAGVSIALMAFLLIGSLYMDAWMERFEERVPGGKRLRSITRAVAAYRDQPGILLGAILVGSLCHAAMVLGGYCFGQAAGMTGLDFSRYIPLVLIAFSVNLIPAAPGGVGQGEQAFAWVFLTATGVAADAARGSTIMLCIRFALLTFGLIGGVVYALGSYQIPTHPRDGDPDGTPGEASHAPNAVSDPVPAALPDVAPQAAPQAAAEASAGEARRPPSVTPSGRLPSGGLA